jgi:hypothetical protein
LIERRKAFKDEALQVSADPWAFENIGGDLIGLAVNFFVWNLLLIVIETNCLNIRKLKYCCVSLPEREKIKMD